MDFNDLDKRILERYSQFTSCNVCNGKLMGAKCHAEVHDQNIVFVGLVCRKCKNIIIFKEPQDSNDDGLMIQFRNISQVYADTGKVVQLITGFEGV